MHNTGQTSSANGQKSRHKPEVVVITGASAGVGRATAQSFARRGAHVALLARGQAGLEGTKRDVERLGGKALALPTDVADAAQVEAAAEAVEREFGPIDIWVNDAMTSVFSTFKEMTPEEFKRVTEVTYLGSVYGTMAALKRMLPRNRGHIVQVGSALAYRGIPLQSAYCGAKHALQGLYDSLRAELLHDGSDVHITMVQMPALNTPQFTWVKSRLPNKAQPVPPIYEPEVAAEAIYWAAHHKRRELLVGLPTFIAVQGNKLAPGSGRRCIWRRPVSSRSRRMSRKVPDRPNNLWEPVDTTGSRRAWPLRQTRAWEQPLPMGNDALAMGDDGRRGRGRRHGRNLLAAKALMEHKRINTLAIAEHGIESHLKSEGGLQDYKDAPPGWTYNPSAWSQRFPIIGIALLNGAIAAYLAVCQIWFHGAAWDPFFGNGTQRVLTSSVSQAFPVSDAALGAGAYLLEASFGVLGEAQRWRSKPWLVLSFGLLVLPLFLTSIGLMILQPIVVHAWCGLCLVMLVGMLLMVPLALDEVIATLRACFAPISVTKH